MLMLCVRSVVVCVDWKPGDRDRFDVIHPPRSKSSFSIPHCHQTYIRSSLAQVVYFGRCIPWMIVDRIPYFRKWKLQQDKVATKAQMWKCTKAVLFSHFTIELPQVRLYASSSYNQTDSDVLADLGIPSARRILWPRDASSAVPFVEIDGVSDCAVLRFRGHVPLLCAPGVALW
jgi:hypothetical protein